MEAAVPLPHKVLQYESFVNDVLRQDLKKVHMRRDRLLSELAEYIQLKNVLETVVELKLDNGFKTKLNLGCDFYVQANIRDASKVFLDVGLGYHVEFTLAEALVFIEKRINLLTQQTASLRKDSAKTKAMIKLVLGGLSELQKNVN
ncbi:protein UXT [Anabrus simplex]|uniref:protein UXT n=1 Tax=Anabrus simplex TaxID=316456 RepID=UPI0034DD2D38